ncbi:tripartite tricarboxylate transporter substrate binding protein [Aquincola sp. MAHUQ-54]|uniref:Tripartite tricarboxylate transporter substrate binding protein n=1 Tax=Aquincola agrisoli TaxID=3119538 RepID=A0AAW9QHF7_9BURK
MHRRHACAGVAAAVLAATLAPAAWAQSPAEQQLAAGRFTIVSPFPPGGPVDTLSRILADGLGKRYGQTVVVDNVAGAAGNLGIDRVKRAKGDGHTLLVVPAGNLTINPTLMPNFPFNIEKDFVPVTMLAKAPNVLVASPAAQLKTAKALVAAAKAKPATLFYASPGVGSGLHLAGELFKQQAEVDITHVPYKGTGPALNDVLGGVVPLMFSNLPATLPFIKDGRLVALGVTEAARSPAAPDIPTLAEQGIPGVVVTSWYGLLAPAGTPAPVVEQLAKDAAQILGQADVRQRLEGQGLSDATMKPADFATHIRNETAVWAKIIKARAIVAE